MKRTPYIPNLDKMVSEQRELVQRGDILVKIHPMKIHAIVGLVQLAMRHPDILEDETAQAGVEFVNQIKQFMTDLPELTKLIDAGWQDLPNDYLESMFAGQDDDELPF